MEIHEALLVAAHAHDPEFAVTATVLLPPAAVGELAVGDIVVLQTTPACVIPNENPATVIVPVRCVVFGLGATLYATVPFPVPLAPLEMDTQDALLVAVQVQPPEIETVIEPLAAAAPTDTPSGETIEVHDTPSCVTVNA